MLPVSIIRRVWQRRPRVACRRLWGLRRGVTLLELMIVITILAMITAATIPLMLSGVDQRRLREATRLVSSYISSARARAIETGRSAGVMIVRSNSGLVPGGSAMNLVTVECPAVYAGDTLLSTVVVSGNQVTFNGNLDNIAANVHVGDIIRFGYQGRTYTLTGSGSQNAGQTLPTGSGGTYTSYLRATDNTGVPPSFSPNATAVPYQVIRQPTKSAVAPLQLPEGVVIDLVQSGGGLTGCITVDSNPIILTFAPTGAAEYIYFNGNLRGHLPSSLCLLMGKPEQVVGTAGTLTNITGGFSNLGDGNSLWVAVTPRGRVITAENAINTAATTAAGARAFVFGYGTGTLGAGGITTSMGGN